MTGQERALDELARHAARTAGTADRETAAWLRGLTDPASQAAWLDGLADTRTPATGPEPSWLSVMIAAAYPGIRIETLAVAS